MPTITWLDGTSDGEAAIEELVEVSRSTGAVAFNIIPDRNYTPNSPDQKLANLQHVIRLTEDLGLPLIGGTEMNSLAKNSWMILILLSSIPTGILSLPGGVYFMPIPPFKKEEVWGT